MATCGGTSSLGRDGEVGRFAVGTVGDLVGWPEGRSAFVGALTDPVETWLRCGLTSAWHAVVAGQVIVRDGYSRPELSSILARHAAAAARLQRFAR